MAVIVHNGLQTCLESQLREPRILRLKLSALPSSSSTPLKSPLTELGFQSFSWDPSGKEHVEDAITNKRNTTISVSGAINGYSFGGFSSLHEFSDTSQSARTGEPSKKESTAIYVHPLQVQSSSMMLSAKGLQLCTENLGNETGTVTTDLNCIESSEPKSGRKVETREETKPARLAGAKKAINMQSFPPPLTTIRGSESLRVNAHREDGRLVIDAVKVPSNATCSFQAERSHGRLRLCLLESTTPPIDAEEDEREYEENKGKNTEEELGKEMENDRNEQREERDEEEEDDKGREYFGDGGESDVGTGSEDLSGNKLIPGDDVGIEMYEMPSTCKKGNHERNDDSLNRKLEAIWVATPTS